jgi:hypothetical protein
MQRADFEKLGVFYLGRGYDAEAKAGGGDLVLVDSKDLTTHAVIVGMTGSGKTGLGVVLLEEAAIDGVPVIAVDPKGDLANLALTFPALRPSDFRPWVREEEAAAEGQTVDALAAARAELWRKGLEAWGQDGDRIRRLREAADVAIYTPGSTAATPISLLRGFVAPPAALREDTELFHERIEATASGLLALLSIDADALTSREHILIANLLSAAWREGRDLDLAGLIAGVQQPPFERIGVMGIETFYPAKDRTALALRLNALLAAPGFQAWMEGPPLDAGRLLFDENGKPRVSVLSMAHLSDAERQFFLSLLLADLIGWMRTQPGTSSLRAVLYIDELFGYMPPVANPPTKPLLLTLLKQARAFGLGVVLATQNPVDLDYKGLSNAGMWFIGRLQTERDRARLLDGLVGASGMSDRGALERIVSGLGKRVFLLHDVRADAPATFETRWALSYLAGPLTRDQLRALKAERPPAEPARPAAPAAARETPAGGARPVAPAGVPQFFLPCAANTAGHVVYVPMALGFGALVYDSAKHNVYLHKSFVRIAAITSAAVPVDWANGETLDIEPDRLESEPLDDAAFDELPVAGTESKAYTAWSRALARRIRADDALILYRSARLRVTSAAGESERDFRIRLQTLSREQRDDAVEKLRAKYTSRLNTLADRLRRAEQAVEREKDQARRTRMDSAISAGTALLGAFLGRRTFGVTQASRVGTAARAAGRISKEAGDVGRAEENVDALRAQYDELEARVAQEVSQLEASYDPHGETLDEIPVRAKTTDVRVQTIGLAWAPLVNGAPAWR